jgi:high affinity sulfate transporter 1
MGYATIAGMPIVTGLYTILFPMALFAVLGSSRHLVVGGDSATAAIMAAGIAGMATAGSSEYIGLAGALALMAGALLIIARLIGLGFLADFLSRTVLIGFLTGVGIQVALGQIPGMLGIPGGGIGPIQGLITDLQQISQTNLYTLAISIGVLVIIIGGSRLAPKIPWPLIAVVGAIIISWALDLQSQGVAVLGSLQGGLPAISLPDVSWSLSLLGQLFGTAFSMFVVILAQSAATSRAYATRYNERFSEDVDLVGLGAANFGAGLTGTFVVNGSPTKTQMVDSAGGRSQIAQLTAALVVVVVLLFLTGPLAFMPTAVLAAVVFKIGVELVDVKGMRDIYAKRRSEFWVALITALTVIFVGVEQGIILAIILSILDHVRRGYKPKNSVLAKGDTDQWRNVPVTSPEQALPGLLIYRFTHSMYYANSEQFSEEVIELVKQADPPLSWFVIDASAIDDVDYSAAATMHEAHGQLQERGVRLVFAEVSDPVRAEMDRYGLTDEVGKDAFFETIAEVADAFQQQNPATATEREGNE